MADHECVRCPSCDSCPACAADALDREVVENERLRERLDQFEAYGFPNVAVLLDRLEALRSQPDAVREAAERAHLDLLSYDEAVTGNEKRHALSRCKNALRDVLRTIDAAFDAVAAPEAGMSEILTHEQHVALVEDLVCCAEQDIRDDMDDSSIATQTRKALVLAQFAALRSALAAAEARLPGGMKHCTIQFKECEKGHGWLTATNWVQSGCPYCALAAASSERDSLRSRLAEMGHIGTGAARSAG